MPPKKKGDGKKKKKSARPPWMSEEMYDLSQNLVKLQEFWSGDVKDSKGKASDKPVPKITRTQAGLFMWQLLFPNNKATMEKRQEGIKLGVVEASVKVLATQVAADMVSAAGILVAMTSSIDACRQTMIDSKPAVVPQLLAGLTHHDSAPLKAGLCALLRVLATNADTRPRLWRSLKDWEWGPLVDCLRLQAMGPLGGRHAAHDAMQAIDALCSLPTGETGTIVCNKLIAQGGVEAVVGVLGDRVSHPMARAYGLSILSQVMRRATAEMCERVVIGAGALQPIVSLLDHPVVPLVHKAHAASILLRYILPDALWKDSSVLAGMMRGGGEARPKTGSRAATAPALLPTGMDGEAGAAAAAAAAAAGAAGGIMGAVGVPSVPGMAQTEEGGGRPGTSGAVGASDASGGAGGPSPEEASPADVEILDEATKVAIAERTAVVARAGAIPLLVPLCVGPEGPLKDLEAEAAAKAAAVAAAAAGGEPVVEEAAKKPKKKKGGKKKKGKLEPGQAEAQAWASAVLRMVSLDPKWRQPLCAAGAIRYLLPLTQSKLHPPRWNARQALVNLSISSELLPQLQLYGVPNHMHGANMPTRHYERPFPPTDATDTELLAIPTHLQPAVASAQRDIAAAKSGVPVTLGFKPPALKSAASTASIRPPAPSSATTPTPH